MSNNFYWGGEWTWWVVLGRLNTLIQVWAVGVKPACTMGSFWQWSLHRFLVTDLAPGKKKLGHFGWNLEPLWWSECQILLIFQILGQVLQMHLWQILESGITQVSYCHMTIGHSQLLLHILQTTYRPCSHIWSHCLFLLKSSVSVFSEALGQLSWVASLVSVNKWVWEVAEELITCPDNLHVNQGFCLLRGSLFECRHLIIR